MWYLESNLLYYYGTDYQEGDLLKIMVSSHSYRSSVMKRLTNKFWLKLRYQSFFYSLLILSTAPTCSRYSRNVRYVLTRISSEQGKYPAEKLFILSDKSTVCIYSEGIAHPQKKSQFFWFIFRAIQYYVWFLLIYSSLRCLLTVSTPNRK